MASFVAVEEKYEYQTSLNFRRLHCRPWVISKNEIQYLMSQNLLPLTLCKEYTGEEQ